MRERIVRAYELEYDKLQGEHLSAGYHVPDAWGPDAEGAAAAKEVGRGKAVLAYYRTPKKTRGAEFCAA